MSLQLLAPRTLVDETLHLADAVVVAIHLRVDIGQLVTTLETPIGILHKQDDCGKHTESNDETLK